MLFVALAVAEEPPTSEVVRRWVDPIEVHGPWFPDEVAAIRGAIAARLKRVPGVEVVDASALEKAANEGRTRLDGPVCADRLIPEIVVERRLDVKGTAPFLDDRYLHFDYGREGFVIEREDWDLAGWLADIRSAESQRLRRGGGGSSLGMGQTPMAMAVEEMGPWDDGGPWKALEAHGATSEALTPCRDTRPERDPHAPVFMEWVVSVAPDGTIRRLEDIEGEATKASVACVKGVLEKARFAPAASERRLVIHVLDGAPKPIPYASIGSEFHTESEYRYDWIDDRRLQACAITKPVPFSIALDATGRVTEVHTDDACVRKVLQTFGLPCPENGPTTLKGTVHNR